MATFFLIGISGFVRAAGDCKPRASAIDHLGSMDELPKGAAVLLLLTAAALFASTKLRLDDQPVLRRWAHVPVWVASIQFVAGTGLASLGLSPALQLVHLIGASLLFGSLAWIALLLAPGRRLPQ